MMSIQLFSLITIIVLLLILLFKRNEVSKFINRDYYYYCLILMMSGILNYPTTIQYLFRAIALAVSWFIIIYKNRGKIKYSRKNVGIKLIALFIVIAYISAVQSVDIFQSIIKVTEVLTDFVLLVLIYQQEGRDGFVSKTYEVIYYYSLVLLAITAVGFIVLPSYFANTGYSALNSYLGIRIGNGIIGANSASAYAILCLCWIILIRSKVDIHAIMVIALCGYVMLYSQSRASLAMIPIIIFLRTIKPKSKYRVAFVIIILIGIYIIFNNWDRIYLYILRGQSTDQFRGLSGRASMWNTALEYFLKRPILGYGYGVGGGYVGEHLDGLFRGIQHMHNAFVETLVDTGIVGLCFLVLQIIYSIFTLVSNILQNRLNNCLLDFVLITYFVIRSVTSLGIASWNSMEIVLWYYLLIGSKAQHSFQQAFMKNGMNKGEGLV